MLHDLSLTPDQFQNVSREEDPFVPTCQDLAGFWDMVSIQVDQIHDRFSKLGDLRKADWIVKVIILLHPHILSQNLFEGRALVLSLAKVQEILKKYLG